ncbi:hypothetical protein RIVM261_079300 [Rivularia sp. IAM M-261]|nr:hypothetical protein RIVM261_079300 [Rivularia sp. IAM M-261]
MAKNWAITIGINKYDYLQPLNYAKGDAQLMHDFLINEVGFEQVFFFSDDSPDIAGKSTRPNRANLRRVLRELFETPFMAAGDNFWFFFSGHGIRHNNRDYLMPYDGDPNDIEETAITINYVTERLRRCGADNVVLILDACRSLAQKGGEGIGRQTGEQATQQGVISIFSCSPQEYSYEIDELQQGAFTRALLDGLGIQGQCATVERLNQYLSMRVPEIVRQHKNGKQTPYIIAEPVNKSHLIIVPQHATLADIATLKIDAYQAEVNKNLELAEQLWIRVLAAASGQDMDAIKGIQRIAILKDSHPKQATSSATTNVETSSKGVSSTKFLKTFQFEVITVDAKGEIINPSNREAEYFVEDLRNGITLDMISIPGGSLMMGRSDNEESIVGLNLERPQRKVIIQPFFMSKYPVTQRQWRMIAALPTINRKLKTEPSRFKGEDLPVERVSWYDVVKFCERLSKYTGRNYRLPSEAEWEYACRAGTTTPFYFGETITNKIANFDCNYQYTNAPEGQARGRTNPVGIFPPNAFGLYDMHGNIWEWCQDYWHDNYQGAPTDGSPWLSGGDKNLRLLRGGSWNFLPTLCRSASRLATNPDIYFEDIGFRVVCGDAARTL